MSQPLQGRLVSGHSEASEPGDFWWAAATEATRHLLFFCPCGSNGCVGALSVGEPVAGIPPWKWDGDLAAPTLSPSVLQRADCGWHGWLRAGVWVSV